MVTAWKWNDIYFCFVCMCECGGGGGGGGGGGVLVVVGGGGGGGVLVVVVVVVKRSGESSMNHFYCMFDTRYLVTKGIIFISASPSTCELELSIVELCTTKIITNAPFFTSATFRECWESGVTYISVGSIPKLLQMISNISNKKSL